MLIQCPYCRQKYDAPEEVQGMETECENCHNVFEVKGFFANKKLKGSKGTWICFRCHAKLAAGTSVCHACGCNPRPPARKKWLYFLLGITFGWIGLHNYYSGNVLIGLIEFAAFLTMLMLFPYCGFYPFPGFIFLILLECVIYSPKRLQKKYCPED